MDPNPEDHEDIEPDEPMRGRRDDQRIEQAEYEREHGRDDDEWMIGQDRYERWLDEINGSR